MVYHAKQVGQECTIHCSNAILKMSIESPTFNEMYYSHYFIHKYVTSHNCRVHIQAHLDIHLGAPKTDKQTDQKLINGHSYEEGTP